MMSSSAETDALDYLKSRMDILDCVNRYTRGVDRLDAEAALSVFHEDAIVDYGVLVGGPRDFVDYFFSHHRRHHFSTNHMICNHNCELDGDVAHAETYFAVATRNRGTPAFGLVGGRYVDRFERREGRWAIVTRKCIGEWSATSGDERVAKLSELFRDVAVVSRDHDDASYERPLTIRPERFGTNVPL
jgi:hypothetical protein